MMRAVAILIAVVLMAIVAVSCSIALLGRAHAGHRLPIRASSKRVEGTVLSIRGHRYVVRTVARGPLHPARALVVKIPASAIVTRTSYTRTIGPPRVGDVLIAHGSRVTRVFVAQEADFAGS